MYWIITATMLYFNTAEIQRTEYNLRMFQDDQSCHQFIYENKVLLTRSLFENFAVLDGKEMKSFEFWCESRKYPEV